MTYIEMLGRRRELLRRNIERLMLKHNKYGLSGQESNFYQHLIKQMHQNAFELNSIRKQS